MERRLIADYRARIETIAAQLSSDNLNAGVALAEWPDQIRGYGPVKEKSVKEAEAKLPLLMKTFEGARSAADAA